MPAEVQDRFKALKVLYVSLIPYQYILFIDCLWVVNGYVKQDEGLQLDDVEEKAYRELELKYDKLYKEVFEERTKILMG